MSGVEIVFVLGVCLSAAMTGWGSWRSRKVLRQIISVRALLRADESWRREIDGHLDAVEVDIAAAKRVSGVAQQIAEEARTVADRLRAWDVCSSETLCWWCATSTLDLHGNKAGMANAAGDGEALNR